MELEWQHIYWFHRGGVQCQPSSNFSLSFPGPGADHVSEEWGERVEDDVWETGEVGLHVSDIRLRQPRARSDPPSQREAARGWESRTVLWALHLQWQVSTITELNKPCIFFLKKINNVMMLLINSSWPFHPLRIHFFCVGSNVNRQLVKRMLILSSLMLASTCFSGTSLQLISMRTSAWMRQNGPCTRTGTAGCTASLASTLSWMVSSISELHLRYPPQFLQLRSLFFL